MNPKSRSKRGAQQHSKRVRPLAVTKQVTTVLNAPNPAPAPATHWPPVAWPEVSAYASKILWQLQSMLFAPPIHRAVRNQLLTNEELARVESDLDLDADKNKASGIKAWMYVKGVSLERALLDVGHQLSLLDEVCYRRTLQELGEEYPANLYSIAGQLRWDRECGTLSYRGRVIRKVRITNETRFHEILDAFEKAGWPMSVPNPFYSIPESDFAGNVPRHDDVQQTYKAIRRLNKGLTAMSFHAEDGGRRVRRQSRSQPAAT